MPKYCVNREGDHEVHNMSCHYLPAPWNILEFEAGDDFSAVEKAKQHYPETFKCFFCMPDEKQS